MSTYKIHPAKVNPENPFSIDLFDREQEIKNLTPLILNLNSPAVFTVNSRWGTGKTTFIEMWSSQLKNEGIHTLKFNAWDTDFSPDPLVAFLGEMNDQLSDLLGSKEGQRKAWKTTQKAAMLILKRAIPGIIKHKTGGALDLMKLEELNDDDFNNFLADLADDALNAYKAQKDGIKKFKELLHKVLKDKDAKSPTVIFVDELDRCRPDYAVSLLERIKHLFDIEGLVFILALDREQLSHSVKSVYGSGIDADGYLRRFIDLEYTLKEPQIDQYIMFLQESLSIDIFINKHPNKLPDIGDELKNMQKTFILLSHVYNLTIREIEQIYSKINLAIRATKPDEYINSVLLTVLQVLKEKDIEIYKKYINPVNDERETVEKLHNKLNHKQRKQVLALIEAFLIVAKPPPHYDMSKSETLKKYDAVKGKGNISDDDQNFARSVISLSRNLSDYMLQINLESIINRIELASEIKLTASEENTEDES